MNKNVKGFLFVAVLVGGAYLAYKHFGPNKNSQVAYLVKNNFTTGTTSDLMAFGEAYIEAWYNAAKSGQPTFTLNQKSYSTKGGKSL